jgi:hypothetical protein
VRYFMTQMLPQQSAWLRGTDSPEREFWVATDP